VGQVINVGMKVGTRRPFKANVLNPDGTPGAPLAAPPTVTTTNLGVAEPAHIAADGLSVSGFINCRGEGLAVVTVHGAETVPGGGTLDLLIEYRVTGYVAETLAGSIGDEEPIPAEELNPAPPADQGAAPADGNTPAAAPAPAAGTDQAPAAAPQAGTTGGASS